MFIKDQGVTIWVWHPFSTEPIYTYIYIRTSTKTKIRQFAQYCQEFAIRCLKVLGTKTKCHYRIAFASFKFLIVKLSLLLKVLATFVSIALKNLKHKFESWFYLFSQGLQRRYRICYEKSSFRGIFLQLGDPVYAWENFYVLT